MKYPESYVWKVGEEEVIVKTVWGLKKKVCQTCKHHHNKPSRCIIYKMNVSRKDRGCKRWRYGN